MKWNKKKRFFYKQERHNRRKKPLHMDEIFFWSACDYNSIINGFLYVLYNSVNWIPIREYTVENIILAEPKLELKINSVEIGLSCSCFDGFTSSDFLGSSLLVFTNNNSSAIESINWKNKIV